MCLCTYTMTPPPIVQPTCVSEFEVPDPSDAVLIAPRPARPYGCTIVILGAIIKLPISVVTDVGFGRLPVKLAAWVNSASKPTTEPSAPREPPQFQFLF